MRAPGGSCTVVFSAQIWKLVPQHLSKRNHQKGGAPFSTESGITTYDPSPLDVGLDNSPRGRSIVISSPRHCLSGTFQMISSACIVSSISRNRSTRYPGPAKQKDTPKMKTIRHRQYSSSERVEQSRRSLSRRRITFL